MKEELKQNKYLILIVLVLISFAIITSVMYKKLNNDKAVTESASSELKKNNIKEDKKAVVDSTTNLNDTPDNFDASKDNDSSNIVDTVPNDLEKTTDDYIDNQDVYDSNNEEVVISYFEELEDTVSNSQHKEITENIKTTLKNVFTTTVDFLFYDEPIKGYTFKELTTEAKLKICKIALSIDNKIDTYFPNYKDTIKSGVTSLKAKVISLYLELTSKLCEKVGDNTCEQARADFKNMKDVLKIDWNLIKEFASTSKGALSEWYQSIK